MISVSKRGRRLAAAFALVALMSAPVATAASTRTEQRAPGFLGQVIRFLRQWLPLPDHDETMSVPPG